MTNSTKKQIVKMIAIVAALLSTGYIANLWIFTDESLVTKILVSAVLYVVVVVSAIAVRLLGEDGESE